MKEKDQKKPQSAKQFEASRNNGKRSNGPTSEAGKRRSAQNAYKHGFYSNRLFPTEELIARDWEGYTRVLAAYRSQYAPVGDLENFYVEQITVHSLRLARLLEHEQKVLTRVAPFEVRSMDKIVRYESNVSRLRDKTIHELERLQQARKAESNQFDPSNLEADEALSKTDEATEEPSEAPPDLKSEELEDVSESNTVPDASPRTAPQLVETAAKQEQARANEHQPTAPTETAAGSAPASVSTLAKIIEKVAGLPPAEELKKNLESPEDCGTFTKSSGRFPEKPGDEKSIESILFGDDIDDFDDPLSP